MKASHCCRSPQRTVVTKVVSVARPTTGHVVGDGVVMVQVVLTQAVLGPLIGHVDSWYCRPQTGCGGDRMMCQRAEGVGLSSVSRNRRSAGAQMLTAVQVPVDGGAMVTLMPPATPAPVVLTSVIEGALQVDGVFAGMAGRQALSMHRPAERTGMPRRPSSRHACSSRCPGGNEWEVVGGGIDGAARAARCVDLKARRVARQKVQPACIDALAEIGAAP